MKLALLFGWLTLSLLSWGACIEELVDSPDWKIPPLHAFQFALTYPDFLESVTRQVFECGSEALASGHQAARVRSSSLSEMNRRLLALRWALVTSERAAEFMAVYFPERVQSEDALQQWIAGQDQKTFDTSFKRDLVASEVHQAIRMLWLQGFRAEVGSLQRRAWQRTQISP